MLDINEWRHKIRIPYHVVKAVPNMYVRNIGQRNKFLVMVTFMHICIVNRLRRFTHDVVIVCM